VLVAGEHAVGQAVVAVELGDHLRGGFAIGVGAGDEGPDGAGFDGLAVVDAVGREREVFEAAAFVELDELGGDLLLELEVGVLVHPVVALLMEEAGEVEQIKRASAVVEPDDAERFILPPELAPVTEGTFGEFGELVAEVAVDEGDDARIAGELLILREGFEGDELRPPVVAGGGTDHAVGGLMRKNPVDVLLGFCFQVGIVEEVRERDEAVEEVGAALPGFACAAEPAAVGADVGPGLVEVAAEAACLDLELTAEPSGGTHGAEGQREESAGLERDAVLDCRSGSSIFGGEEGAGRQGAEGGYDGLLKETATGSAG